MTPPVFRVGALSVNRSDFGRMTPLYRRLLGDPRFHLSLSVIVPALGGEAFLSEIKDVGAVPEKTLFLRPNAEMTDSAVVIFSEMTETFKACRPDLLLVLGDRFELLPVVSAAFLARLPILHIGGGYVTEGAIDDRVRGAVTALASWHLVANSALAERVIAGGAKPETVLVTGAPDIEALIAAPVVAWETVALELGMDPDRDFLLVTVHPETRGDAEKISRGLDAAFEVLRERPEQLLITAPAPDPGADGVLARISALSAARREVFYVPSLGQKRYVSAMRRAAALFGNSSSGAIESSAIPVPVVNIGDRQKGRQTAANVLSVPMEKSAMADALTRATAKAFRAAIGSVVSPYGDAFVTDRIFAFLERLAANG